MKRNLCVLFALLFAFATLTACGGSDSIVGTWEAEEGDLTGAFVFNEDGTGSVSVEGVSMNTTWSVEEGKYLTVSMEVAGIKQDLFKGAEFSVKNGELTITANGEAAVFKKK